MDKLKNGTGTFPSSLKAVECNGVSDPVQSAPSPVPSASVNVTKKSLLEGRLASKRGIDKADQKLRLPIDGDDSKSLMRAAKLNNEQTISTCAVDKTLDKICTAIWDLFGYRLTNLGRVLMNLRSRIRNRVNEAAKATTRQARGNALDASEAFLIFHAISYCGDCHKGLQDCAALVDSYLPSICELVRLVDGSILRFP